MRYCGAVRDWENVLPLKIVACLIEENLVYMGSRHLVLNVYGDPVIFDGQATQRQRPHMGIGDGYYDPVSKYRLNWSQEQRAEQSEHQNQAPHLGPLPSLKSHACLWDDDIAANVPSAAAASSTLVSHLMSAILFFMSESRVDHLFLSPHLDDVVLSCGGTIHKLARAGDPVLVLTFFAGSPSDASVTPIARELMLRWGGVQDPVAARRDEDCRALSTLGAEVLHLPFLDCVYRLGPTGGAAYYPTEETIFGEIHSQEAAWHRELLEGLERHTRDIGGAILYAPLAAGHHVDHLLVGEVARILELRGQHTLYYEDYPYAQDQKTITVARARWSEACWSRETMRFDELDLRAKEDAIACYASQLGTFWSDAEEMRRDVRHHAGAEREGTYGESYWRVLADDPGG